MTYILAAPTGCSAGGGWARIRRLFSVLHKRDDGGVSEKQSGCGDILVPKASVTPPTTAYRAFLVGFGGGGAWIPGNCRHHVVCGWYASGRVSIGSASRGL